jgi:hypothetical protein
MTEAIFYIIPMKKKNIIMAKVAETSKIGLAGIFAGVFCLIFALVYTLVSYAKRRE